MRVIVVGAGVIGRSIAWRAARHGLSVTVVDPAPRRAAARVAAGMLAPVSEAGFGEEALLALNLASARRWPGFAADLAADAGADPGFAACGTVLVARDADDRAALDRLLAFQRELGLDVERLGARALRAHEPALGPAMRGGLLVRGDHQVHNRRLLGALAAAGAARGVRDLRVAASAVHARGVDLADGRTLDADAVVLCAGVWSAQLLPGLPVRPVKGQIVRLRASRRSLAPRCVVRAPDVYLVPRSDGEVVVGATMEERGHDLTVTAGAVAELLRAAWEVVPGSAEMELVEAAAGLRPTTPGNRPLIGAAANGVVVATGHHRHGILLAPVTADAVTALLTGAQPPVDLRAFAPGPAAAPEVAACR